ncbi:MAG: nucleotidyltransferase family protein [Hyphomicrobiales bacterium]|nr:nucleotidyltransferase family protein [Hyphomicrobiales bacterium]
MTAPARISQAMVLAAGLGTRMRPHSESLPKPLVRLARRALIDHVLDRLAENGVERAVVNVHHLAEQIEAHLAGRAAPRIVISDERGRLLETGGGVAKALPLFDGAPFFIHNSDSVWIEAGRSNLAALADAWSADRMDALLLLAPASRSLGYDGRGDFHMTSGGAVARRGPADAAPFVFTGVSVAHPRLFEAAPAGPFSLNRLWDAALARGRVFGVEHQGLWMHVGDPAALAAAEDALARSQAAQ